MSQHRAQLRNARDTRDSRDKTDGAICPLPTTDHRPQLTPADSRAVRTPNPIGPDASQVDIETYNYALNLAGIL